MKRVLAVLMAMFIGGAAMNLIIPESAFASTDKCPDYILGLRPWYAGLTASGSCDVEMPPKDDTDELTKRIWTIILNLLYDATVLVGLVASGFIIYAGFRYMTMRGDPGAVASAKKMIASAVIGLIIAVLATVIVNTILYVLSQAIS